MGQLAVCVYGADKSPAPHRYIHTYISLPSLWQHYLVAMATPLDKLENKVHMYHLRVKRFHMMKRLRKSVQYIRRYSTKYASFLGLSDLTFTNELCQLWSYWTEFHEIFTRYIGIICAVNVHSKTMILQFVF